MNILRVWTGVLLVVVLGIVFVSKAEETNPCAGVAKPAKPVDTVAVAVKCPGNHFWYLRETDWVDAPFPQCYVLALAPLETPAVCRSPPPDDVACTPETCWAPELSDLAPGFEDPAT